MRRVPRAIAFVGWACLALVLCMIAGGILLHLPRERSPHWMQFTIGPASGTGTNVQPDGIRSTGVTLRGAIALAYDVPAVRVIGPAWLDETRYSITAVVATGAADSWRPLFQQELNSRLRLQTHLEHRPFDVLMLGVTGSPRMRNSPGGAFSAWIGDERARLHSATMSDLALLLHGIVGMPVIDETGLRGAYDMEFGWRTDRIPSVTTALEDQFGLQLSAGRRELEALIVDDIRREAALVVLAQVGRVTRAAPPSVRRGIADLLTIR